MVVLKIKRLLCQKNQPKVSLKIAYLLFIMFGH